MKERIKKLLAQGLKATDVATIVGCSPAYISQLLKDEEFKKSVEMEMIQLQETASEDEHLDTSYKNLEHAIVRSIAQDLPSADLNQKVRALEVVGKRSDERKRAKLPAQTTNPGSSNGVNIHITQIALPAHVAAQPVPLVQMNENREIIAIDNKTFAPMSSDGVKNIFAQMNATKQAVPMQIPANIVEEL